MAHFKARNWHFSRKKVFLIPHKLMNNFKNGLEKLQIAPRRSGTSHSTSFFPGLNLKMEKKSFRNFQPIKSSLFLRKKFFLLDFLLRNNSGFYGRNDFFSVFKLSAGKKPVECDVPDLLEAICRFSKPFLVH